MAQQVHVVQRGENLFRIAQQYGRTLAEVAQANGIAPPYTIHMGNFITIPAPGGGTQAPAPAPAPQQPTGTSTYAVQRGESLAIIAIKFNTTYIVLAEMNGIADPNILHVGQVLRVPAPASAPAPTDSGAAAPAPQPATGVYTVQRGDSLAIIAAKFNINYFELAQLNGITNPDVLTVGEVLRVPGAPPPAPAPAPGPADPAPAAPVGPGPPSTANVSGFELGGQALSFAHPEFMRSARMTWVKRQVKWHGEPAGHFQPLIDSAHGNGFRVLLSVIG
ncbi:MAG: LysM peptidoglycan-binding domain-containing protein, partial [Chloroflexi bacterium]|nr:LysM peptidoglycan-binding domain-containing protein [Chloroflexota bacterium]